MAVVGFYSFCSLPTSFYYRLGKRSMLYLDHITLHLFDVFAPYSSLMSLSS
jgi:hypothetical protein